MDKRSGIEGVARVLGLHACSRQFSQFVINQVQQRIRGLRIAAFDGRKDTRDVAGRHGFGRGTLWAESRDANGQIQDGACAFASRIVSGFAGATESLRRLSPVS